MEKFKTGVIGADTRIGQELVRRLLMHPFVEVVAASSAEYSGKPLSHICPSLCGMTNLPLVKELDVIAKSDVVFNADMTIDGQELGAQCIKNKCVFIDLGEAFRLADEEAFDRYFGSGFAYAGLHDAAIYGLPELMRDQMPGKVLIANPGAVATGAALALTPLILDGLIIADGIFIDAVVSTADIPPVTQGIRHTFEGAGNAALCPSEGVAQYEIEQMLSIAAARPIKVTCATNAVGISRGVLVNCFVRTQLSASDRTLTNSLVKLYDSERFVRILPPGVTPSVQAVCGTNYCDISVRFMERSATAVITAALDPLGKGSAGQAVQNMNALLSVPEHLSL